MLVWVVTLLSSSLSCIYTETVRFRRGFYIRSRSSKLHHKQPSHFRMYIMRMFLTVLGYPWFLQSNRVLRDKHSREPYSRDRRLGHWPRRLRWSRISKIEKLSRLSDNRNSSSSKTKICYCASPNRSTNSSKGSVLLTKRSNVSCFIQCLGRIAHDVRRNVCIDAHRSSNRAYPRLRILCGKYGLISSVSTLQCPIPSVKSEWAFQHHGVWRLLGCLRQLRSVFGNRGFWVIFRKFGSVQFTYSLFWQNFDSPVGRKIELECLFGILIQYI